jgi:hypothetical protein
MVKDCAVPEQLTPFKAYVGVTLTCATIGLLPLFTALNEAILPDPEAANPMAVALFVQLNTVPATVPVNDTAVVGDPLHTTWFASAATVGVGFTVIVN